MLLQEQYLPFHLIVNETKSTPIRIVYNGSARTKRENNSINDCLLKGVNLLSKMLPILLRIRMNKTLILADIEKAFHQIGLKSTERNYLRFLWYENATDNTAMKKIVTYRFCRVPFGIISSQFILAAVIIFLLKQNITKFTELILNHLYLSLIHI